MTLKQVDAVWLFEYQMSHFKALYGRGLTGSGHSEYSKDFLQIPRACRDEFFRVLGRRLVRGQGIQLVYKWPGGQSNGLLQHTSDRLNLRWPTAGLSPEPWRLTPTVTPGSVETFEGNPNLTAAADANAEWARFDNLNQDPWLVVVKLKGEYDILHLRAYLGNPPSHLAHSSTTRLPTLLQDAMARIRGGSAACGAISLAQEPSIDDLRPLLDTLDRNPNVLLVGPPGTGKTVLLEKMARYVEQQEFIFFDESKNHDAFFITAPTAGKARTVVFHPSYSYQDLVLGLYPTSKNGAVSVEVKPGPLINLAHYSTVTGSPSLLVLDEFNRGNAASILGDVLALLDVDKRQDLTTNQPGGTVDLPYGDTTIEVEDDYALPGKKVVSPRFSLPSNLWIVAAMNSSDRSVAPLDAALRRRFSIVHIPPDYNALADRLGVTPVPLSPGAPIATSDDVLRLSLSVMSSLNERLEAVLGPDFLLGQSHFWHVAGSTVQEVVESLSRAIDERVIPTLRMMFTDNDDELALIVDAGSRDATTPNAATRLAYWWFPSGHLAGQGYERIRFNLLSQLSDQDALAELVRLAGL